MKRGRATQRRCKQAGEFCDRLILKPVATKNQPARTGIQAASRHGAAVIPRHCEGCWRSPGPRRREDHCTRVRRRGRSALGVEKGDPLSGVKITITTEVFDVIGRYATWRFHEGTILDRPLNEQRLVKAERSILTSMPYLILLLASSAPTSSRSKCSRPMGFLIPRVVRECRVRGADRWEWAGVHDTHHNKDHC